MDLSKKPKSGDFLFAEVQKVLQQHIKQGDHVCVALSGGVDSVVLLDLLADLSKQMQFSLSAVHVNHGISGNATTWSQFCSKLAFSYGIAIEVADLNVQKERGVSLEASAREQRYQVFSKIVANYVVLAQHMDDQAETLLLQLLRGAGIRGLSGMPVIRPQAHLNQARVLRPLLNVSRHQIEQYAQSKDLTWIIDESNDDTNYDRNFLRHDVLPILKKRYGSYAKTFTRASRHLSEASILLDELAEIDRERCLIAGRLSLQCLRQLSSRGLRQRSPAPGSRRRGRRRRFVPSRAGEEQSWVIASSVKTSVLASDRNVLSLAVLDKLDDVVTLLDKANAKRMLALQDAFVAFCAATDERFVAWHAQAAGDRKGYATLVNASGRWSAIYFQLWNRGAPGALAHFVALAEAGKLTPSTVDAILAEMARGTVA